MTRNSLSRVVRSLTSSGDRWTVSTVTAEPSMPSSSCVTLMRFRTPFVMAAGGLATTCKQHTGLYLNIIRMFLTLFHLDIRSPKHECQRKEQFMEICPLFCYTLQVFWDSLTFFLSFLVCHLFNKKCNYMKKERKKIISFFLLLLFPPFGSNFVTHCNCYFLSYYL